MARFYSAIQGARGEATRLGHAGSGIRAEAMSWKGKVVTTIDADGDEDIVSIRAAQHGNSRNPTGYIFKGTFNQLGELIGWQRRADEIRAFLALSKGEE